LKEQGYQYARGQRIEDALPEIVLYAKCDNWKVLPDAGGIYQQNPDTLESFSAIEEGISLYMKEKERESSKKLPRRR
jgi:hypothetical protein